MTKVAFITDTHLGIRDGSPIFHANMSKFFKVFFDTLAVRQIKHIIHAGDMFHKQRYVDFLSANVARKAFFEPIQAMGIETHIIAGNHDQFYKSQHDVNSLREIVGNRYSHIKIYDTPALITIDDLPIQLLPWITNTNKMQSLDVLKSSPSEILIGHLEVLGFEMDKGIKAEHGMEHNAFSRFDKVFSGHFHHRSSKGNIHYLGAFSQHRWTDFNDPRGFAIFDTETREIEYIDNPYEIFHVIEYDENDTYTFSDYARSYVKVLVRKPPDSFLFDKFKSDLEEAAPIDITIIDNPEIITDTQEDVAVDETEDTPTLLKTYISGLTLPIENDIVVSFMQDIYKEASSAEAMV